MTEKLAKNQYDAIVIGAGFFGLSIADYLCRSGMSNVLIIEAENSSMSRASYVNQARIHVGYHYPRSVLTAIRSRISSNKFIHKYASAVVNDFQHIYACGKVLGKTSSLQFERFCRNIGAPLSETTFDQSQLFSPELIEKTWIAEEFAFNSNVLREIVTSSIRKTEKATFWFNTEAIYISNSAHGVEVGTNRGKVSATIVISCLYAEVNNLHRKSGLPLLPLQFEIAEMALVEMPNNWKKKAVTVMDGPFFSLMPFPSEDLYSLSHVRYTPQLRWTENSEEEKVSFKKEMLSNYPSSFREMKADVIRYIPEMSGMKYQKSLREVKTVLSKNDLSDSRPTLVRNDFGIKGYYAILGGKIDNVDDAIEELKIQISNDKLGMHFERK